MLTGKHVVLGVTGGIAAYKACEVVSRLKKLHAEVDVIMTENATKLVAPLTFETLSCRPVSVDTFSRTESWDVKHISLAQKADLMLVAPATANLMAKLACGIADDMLSTTLLATKTPILLAPAMNTGMWTAPSTRHNHAVLLERGVQMVGPASGHLACGDTGEGRMSEPEEIVDAACKILLGKKDLAGKKILVTAGPTVERIDPVRYITNDSSGKMGYAIAQAALERGAEVTLVSGPVSIAPPIGANVVKVTSTEDLLEKMLSLCQAQNVIIQSAAPADYRPERMADQKIKKQAGEDLVLRLKETPDVAKAVGEIKKPGQILVGFAAETQAVVENAEKKLVKKNLDLIVANDVTAPGAGFGVDTNIITLIDASGQQAFPMMSKKDAAHVILNWVANRMS